MRLVDSTKRQTIFGALVLTISLALVACGGDGDGSDTPSTSGLSATTSATGSATPLPLPADFPSPGDATVVSVTDEAGLKVSTLTTADHLDVVVAFYEEALATPPWNMTGRTDLPDQKAVVLTFANVDDPRVAGTMTLLRDSNDTHTLVTVTFIITAAAPSPAPAAATATS